MQELIEQREQQKQLADYYFSHGNFDAAKIKDEIVYNLDMQILNIMCPTNEAKE
jgi:hypothetical protein